MNPLLLCFADRRGRVWVSTRWPGWLRVVNEHTGRRRRAMWPIQLVIDCYGPLWDVTP